MPIRLYDFDLYANDIIPPSILGFIVSVKVVIATIIYSLFLLLKTLQTPPVKEVGSEWTLGVKPIPINITCHSEIGCIVYNDVSSSNSFLMNRYIPDNETKCFNLSSNMSSILHIVYSLSVNEGIKIAWKGNNTPSLQSEIRCPQNTGKGCVQYLNLPISTGLTGLNYVETFNDTEIGPSRHRREWFMNIISDSKNINWNSEMCVIPHDYKIGLVQLNSLYNIVTVKKTISYTELLGTIGGTFSVFVTGGGFILIAMKYLYKYCKFRRNGVQVTNWTKF